MKTPEFKIQQNLIASERNRRLTTYRRALTEMKDNQKPYPEMLHWLQQQGEECSTARLKVFFRHCGHRQKIENRWFEFTLSKAESDGLQEFLKNNPPPETATVIALLRHSILQQATSGKVTDESLKLTARLARTLMTYELALKKLDQGERSLKLAEKRLEMGGGKSERATEPVVEFDNREKIAAIRLRRGYDATSPPSMSYGGQAGELLGSFFRLGVFRVQGVGDVRLIFSLGGGAPPPHRELLGVEGLAPHPGPPPVGRGEGERVNAFLK
jgi:hypothetical protein